MDIEWVVRWIGLSHLLQPPITFFLAREWGLRRAFQSLPPLPGRIAENMGVAAIALPTLLGVFLAIHAEEVVTGGPVRHVAFAVALFWIWRLERQLRVIGPLLGGRARAWHRVLAAIFIVQGPTLAVILVVGTPRG